MEQGLNEAAAKHGFEGDGFSYLRNPTWWGGIITCRTTRRQLEDTSIDILL